MPSGDPSFEKLLDFIRSSRAFDFTGYKRPSLQRRITKRMQVVGATDYDDYLVYLESHAGEFAELFDTILINVTSFFRDPDAWDYVAEEIVPQIVRASTLDEIRVWTPGCATGQEAYTAAMILCESLGEDAFRARVKIYATDVDAQALTKGRHPRYTSKEVESVPDDLRARYFEDGADLHSFRADLRRNVIFGRHDLIHDPPISRIDLLIVRNTMMYFNAETQSRVLKQLHFALRDTGFLFLGKSEVLLSRSSLFEPVELRHRIFAKSEAQPMRDRLLALVPDGDGERRVAEFAHDAALEGAPFAYVAVDAAGALTLANLQARTLFGLTQKDLGRPLQDLELSYRPLELRSLIERAGAERHQVTVRDVEHRSGVDVRVYDVLVAPLADRDGASVGTGISFIDVTRYRRLTESLEDSKGKLETAFEELQSTAEELETPHEELQSTNEELEPTNEELQSTNEELETMNEELQSTNEELETINEELRQRTLDLNEVNSFLESILVSLGAGVVVVDEELRVRAWNEQAAELWGLRPDEVQGQHLLGLDMGLPVDELKPLLRECLNGSAERQEITLDAVNRRGKPIKCRVTCTPLLGPGKQRQGVILVMEEL